jgi:CubicO group peptidase (beta-lactamase class C family)
MIFAERFMYEPWADTLYSDLGFMILAVILERESEMTTDQCAQEWVFEPIGAPNVLFRPAARGRSIACTRDDEPAGLVHDLNCRALGGVSGHAGLFGDARSVAGIMRQFIESGEQNRLLPHAIIHEFVTRVGRPAHSSRALGFDTPSPGSSSGCCFSPTSFGHTGFTGVSVWLDPEIALTVVLLTNRVYMGESDMRIKDFRPRIHDLVRKELLKT